MLRINTLTALKLMLFALILIGLAGCTAYKPAPAPTGFEGSWLGLGKNQIPNTLVNQREIGFMLMLNAQGKVKGYIGDAVINDTVLLKPNWLMSLFGKKEYKINCTLKGQIIQRENISRPSGTIVITGLDKGELLCSFLSSGPKDNTRNQAMSVTDIRLKKVAEAPF